MRVRTSVPADVTEIYEPKAAKYNGLTHRSLTRMVKNDRQGRQKRGGPVISNSPFVGRVNVTEKAPHGRVFKYHNQVHET